MTDSSKWLELKIPPLIVWLVFAGAMLGVAYSAPSLTFSLASSSAIAVILVALGVAVTLAGVIAFRDKRTTVNPLQPQKTSALVTSGIYRVTRNPMYVGMAFLLTAWAVYLASAWALLGPLLFVAYITRFQILPEEAALHRLFGASFAAYCQRVRRWL